MLVYKAEELRGNAAAPGGIAEEVVFAPQRHERDVYTRVFHQRGTSFRPGERRIGVSRPVEQQHRPFCYRLLEVWADRDVAVEIGVVLGPAVALADAKGLVGARAGPPVEIVGEVGRGWSEEHEGFYVGLPLRDEGHHAQLATIRVAPEA